MSFKRRRFLLAFAVAGFLLAVLALALRAGRTQPSRSGGTLKTSDNDKALSPNRGTEVPPSEVNLRARVMDSESNMPVYHALVKIHTALQAEPLLRLHTDRSGLAMTRLEPGSYTLVPSLVDEGPEAKGCEAQGEPVEVTIRSLKEVHEIALFIRVPPTVTVWGSCVGGDGSALPGTEVLVCSQAADRSTRRAFRWASGKADDKGNFSIESRLLPGEYYLSTWSDVVEGVDGDEAGITFQVTERPGSQKTRHLLIVHGRGKLFNTIRGIVVNEFEKPIEGARVEIESPEMKFLNYPVVLTDTNGKFQSKGEGLGEAEIVVRHARFGTVRYPIGFINPYKSSNFVSEEYLIKLRTKEVRIFGRILDKRGRPIDHNDVKIVVMEWVRNANIQVNPEVPVHRLPEGTFEIYADKDKYYSFGFETNPDTLGRLTIDERKSMRLTFNPPAQVQENGRFSFTALAYELEVAIPK